MIRTAEDGSRTDTHELRCMARPPGRRASRREKERYQEWLNRQIRRAERGETTVKAVEMAEAAIKAGYRTYDLADMVPSDRGVPRATRAIRHRRAWSTWEWEVVASFPESASARDIQLALAARGSVRGVRTIWWARLKLADHPELAGPGRAGAQARARATLLYSRMVLAQKLGIAPRTLDFLFSLGLPYVDRVYRSAAGMAGVGTSRWISPDDAATFLEAHPYAIRGDRVLDRRLAQAIRVGRLKDPHLTFEEAARRLGISTRRLRRWYRECRTKLGLEQPVEGATPDGRRSYVSVRDLHVLRDHAARTEAQAERARRVYRETGQPHLHGDKRKATGPRTRGTG